MRCVEGKRDKKYKVGEEEIREHIESCTNQPKEEVTEVARKKLMKYRQEEESEEVCSTTSHELQFFFFFNSSDV